MAVKVIEKYCCRVFVHDSNPHSQYFLFNYTGKLPYPNLSINPFFTVFTTRECDLDKEKKHTAEQRTGTVLFANKMEYISSEILYVP
jgi:hypothetical protein